MHDECLVSNSYVCLLLLSELYNVKPYHRFAVERCFDGRKFPEIEIKSQYCAGGLEYKVLFKNMPRPPPANNNATHHVKEE